MKNTSRPDEPREQSRAKPQAAPAVLQYCTARVVTCHLIAKKWKRRYARVITPSRAPMTSVVHARSFAPTRAGAARVGANERACPTDVIGARLE